MKTTANSWIPFAVGLFIALMMEAVCTSKISVCSDEIKRRYIPEGCNFLTVTASHQIAGFNNNFA
jgi:hypothetical protein